MPATVDWDELNQDAQMLTGSKWFWIFWDESSELPKFSN